MAIGNKAGVLVAAAAVLALAGCLPGEKAKPAKFGTDYQAVFLQNGQVYFGKLEGLENDYPVLRDVYQIQQQVNQETRQVANIMVKRINEPHAPDMMMLNAKQIAFVEPVGAGSRVGQFLSGASAAPSGAAKQ